MPESTVAKEKIDGEGVKVVNFSLRLSTVAMLKAHTKAKGVPMSRTVDDALRDFFAKEESEGKS